MAGSSEDLPDIASGEPVEQRKREKATLQSLNERLETVLGNIRRDNIKLNRTIKDHEGEIATCEEVKAIINEEQARLEQEMQNMVLKNASMVGNKVSAAHSKAGIFH